MSLLSYLRLTGRCWNSKYILGLRKLSADFLSSGKMSLEKLFLQRIYNMGTLIILDSLGNLGRVVTLKC